MATAHEELIRCTDYLERFNTLRTIPEWISEVEKTLDELMVMEYSGLYLYNQDTERLELLVAKGFTEDERLAAESTAMERHPGKVFQSGEGWYIPDVLNDPTYTTTDSDRSFQVRSRLYHPIRVEGKVVGVFGAVSSRVDAFSPMERESFRFLIHLSATIYLRIKTEEANSELNRVKDRLSFIATHTDNMVVLKDADQRIEWVNAAFERVSGYHLSEVIGRFPDEVLRRSYKDEESKRRMEEAIRKGEPCMERVVNYRKDGVPYHVEIQIYPIKNDEGKIANFISIQRDITEAVKAKEEIEASRNQLSAVINALPDELILIRHSADTQKFELQPLTPVRQQMIQFINDSGMASKLGEQLSGRDKEKGDENLEMIMQCPDTHCFFETRLSPIDEVQGVLLIRDITKRKELEADRDVRMKELEKALADVKSRNDRLHNFSNVLSHNIRSHTSNIMALVKLIQMHPIPDGAIKFFEVLDRSVHNLDETIRSLNSTISMGVDPKVDKEAVDINRLIRKIIDSLAFDIQETQATFECDCESAPLIWSDKALLESIVMNLITNAIKYRSADREPHIHVSTFKMGNGFELKVKDNGRGIDLERHGSDIFGMFKTFNSEGKGQGIGLYLTRNQAEMMGGTVTVESTPDVGTTFTVYLPGNEQ
ncbi:MAG: hypothetical protein RL226_1555 [Bacteroidota bacterium]